MRRFIIYIVVLQSLSCTLLAQKRSTSTKDKNKKNSENQVSIVSYSIAKNGDTINALDSKQRKQGLWIIEHEALRGEPGYTEMGKFTDNTKVGKWKSYNTEGIVIKEENFKQGALDGEIKYYDDGFLSCVGNYKALNAKAKYDTFYVEMPNVETPVRKILPASMGAVKHGFWTFYDAPLSRIVRVQEYQGDELIYEKEYTNNADSAYIKQRQKLYPTSITAMPEKKANYFWIKDKNKKVVRYTDFPDNPTSIKPNVRKK